MKDPVFFSCADWEQIIAAITVEELSPAEHEVLNAHLATCPTCAAVLADYQEMDALISNSLLPERPLELPEGLFAPCKEMSIVRGLQQRLRRDVSTPVEPRNVLSERVGQHVDFPPGWKGVEHERSLAAMEDTSVVPAYPVHPFLNDTLIPATGESRTTTSYAIHILAQGQMDKYTELTLEDTASAELAIENLVSLILVDMFDDVAIEEVCISSPPDLTMNQLCSLLIRASFWKSVPALCPQELLRMELTVEDAISCNLVQLFGMVIINEVQILSPVPLLEALD